MHLNLNRFLLGLFSVFISFNLYAEANEFVDSSKKTIICQSIHFPTFKDYIAKLDSLKNELGLADALKIANTWFNEQKKMHPQSLKLQLTSDGYQLLGLKLNATKFEHSEENNSSFCRNLNNPKDESQNTIALSCSPDEGKIAVINLVGDDAISTASVNVFSYLNNETEIEFFDDFVCSTIESSFEN